METLRERAAGFYLVDNSKEAVEALYKAYDEDVDQIPDEVLVWEPFEYFSVNELVNNIDVLKESFEDIQKTTKEVIDNVLDSIEMDDDDVLKKYLIDTLNEIS